MNDRQILYNLADAGAGGSSSAPGAGAAGGGAGPSPAVSAGGSPAAGAPGRSGETGAGQGAIEGTAAAQSAWKAPDFLPDHLRDADVAKTFDKVAGDWKRLRDEVANRPAPAKTVDEYAWEPSDKVKPFLAGDLKQDPVYAHAREAALKAGLPAPVFAAFVSNLYEGLADAKALPEPYNPERERDALIGDRARLMTAEQKDAEIRPILMPIVGFLDGLKRTGAIDDRGYAALGALLDTAPVVRALAKIADIASRGAPGLAPGGQAAGARVVSHADLKARQADPRNNPDSVSFDRTYREETTRLYQQLFG